MRTLSSALRRHTVQSEDTLKSEVEVMSVVAGLMAIVSFSVSVASHLNDFTPAGQFVLGIMMAVTVIMYAILATLKTVYPSIDYKLC